MNINPPKSIIVLLGGMAAIAILAGLLKGGDDAGMAPVVPSVSSASSSQGGQGPSAAAPSNGPAADQVPTSSPAQVSPPAPAPIAPPSITLPREREAGGDD